MNYEIRTARTVLGPWRCPMCLRDVGRIAFWTASRWCCIECVGKRHKGGRYVAKISITSDHIKEAV